MRKLIPPFVAYDPTITPCKMIPVGPGDDEGLRCETHGCEPMDPCLRKDCPHCTRERRQGAGTRAIKRKLRADAAVLRWEEKAYRALGALLAARKEQARARKQLRRAGAEEHEIPEPGDEPEGEEGEG